MSGNDVNEDTHKTHVVMEGQGRVLPIFARLLLVLHNYYKKWQLHSLSNTQNG